MIINNFDDILQTMEQDPALGGTSSIWSSWETIAPWTDRSDGSGGSEGHPEPTPVPGGSGGAAGNEEDERPPTPKD